MWIGWNLDLWGKNSDFAHRIETETSHKTALYSKYHSEFCKKNFQDVCQNCEVNFLVCVGKVKNSKMACWLTLDNYCTQTLWKSLRGKGIIIWIRPLITGSCFFFCFVSGIDYSFKDTVIVKGPDLDFTDSSAVNLPSEYSYSDHIQFRRTITMPSGRLDPKTSLIIGQFLSHFIKLVWFPTWLEIGRFFFKISNEPISSQGFIDS